MVAHRGHCRAAPELPLKAVDLAVRAGAHVVEIDVAVRLMVIWC